MGYTATALINYHVFFLQIILLLKKFSLEVGVFYSYHGCIIPRYDPDN